MAGIVDTISLAIEDWVLDYFGDASPDMHFKNWGFVELANRGSKDKAGNTSNQPIPVTINGTGQRDQVSLNDRYDYMHWIRWVSPITSVDSEEDSWGLHAGKRQRIPLRIVIAHKVEIGENFILELVSGLPENVIVPGFDFVFLNSDYSIDPDHEEIYRTELGNTVYEQHRFNWNLYVIDLNVEFVICYPPTARTGCTGQVLLNSELDDDSGWTYEETGDLDWTFSGGAISVALVFVFHATHPMNQLITGTLAGAHLMTSEWTLSNVLGDAAEIRFFFYDADDNLLSATNFFGNSNGTFALEHGFTSSVPVARIKMWAWIDSGGTVNISIPFIRLTAPVECPDEEFKIFDFTFDSSFE